MSESKPFGENREALFEVSRLYKLGSQEAPPPALDAAILAQAAQELRAPRQQVSPPFGNRFAVPLSLAAVLVLSVTIVTWLPENGEFDPAGVAQVPAESGLLRRDASPSGQTAAQSAKRGTEASKRMASPPLAAPARGQEAAKLDLGTPSIAQPLELKARTERERAPSLRQPPPPGHASAAERDSARARNSNESEAGSVSREVVRGNGFQRVVKDAMHKGIIAPAPGMNSASKPAAMTTLGEARTANLPAKEVTANKPPSQQDWLTLIESLLDAGRIDEARLRFYAFREQYPHAAIKPGLLERLRM